MRFARMNPRMMFSLAAFTAMLLAAPLSALAQWAEMGPSPIASGPFTGRIAAVVTSPTDANKYYIGGADGGVWKTLNGGVSWTPLTDDMPSAAIGALAVDPLDDNIVYAGTGEANYANHCVYGLGLYKTTDGGTSWEILAAGAFSGRTFARLMVSPTNRDALYAAVGYAGGFPARVAGKGHPGTNGPVGIFKSTDAGATWTHLTNGIPAVAATDVVVDPTNGNRVFAAIGHIFGDAANGIYRSLDGGNSWTRLAGGLPTGAGRISLAIAPSDPNRLYAILANPSDSGGGGASTRGVYRSNDGGNTWVNTNSGNFQATYGWYLSTVAVHPTNPETFFVGGLEMLRGSSGGQSYLNRTPPHVDLHALAFDAAGRLLAADDGGLHRSDNLGDSWIALNNGLGLIQFYAGLSIHPTLAGFVLAGFQDNGSCRRQENGTWSSVLGGDGGHTAISPTNANILFAEYQGSGNLYRSTDGGGDFNYSGSGISGSDRNCFLPPVIYNPTTAQQLYYATHRIYRSSNDGSSWSAVSGDITGGGSAAIRALVAAPSNGQTLYAATNDGRVLNSRNGGAAWDLRLSGNPGWPRVTREIAVDPDDEATAYLGVAWFGEDQVLKTTDYGQTWSAIDGDLPDVPVNSVAVCGAACQRILFAGTDRGVYYTLDENQWRKLGNNLPNSPVIDLVVDAGRDRLVAATQGRGLWQNPLPSLDCELLNKLAVKCRNGKLKAAIKSGFAQGTSLTLTNNGGDPLTVTVDAKGKAKATWTNQTGQHEVCLPACDACDTADCG